MTIARFDVNPRPDKWITGSTASVIDPRVKSEILTADAGALLRRGIGEIEAPADAFDEAYRRGKESLLPAKLPELVQREGEKALAAIEAGARPYLDGFVSMINTEQFAARPKAPSPVTPELREKLSRALDHLEKREVSTRKKSVIRESAVTGDDEPFLAYELLAPKIVRDEVIDEKLDAQLTEIWLARRPEVKKRRDSAQMAHGLLENCVYAATSFVRSKMPRPPSADLLSSSGRRVARG